MWCSTLEESDILRELGRKVPFCMNPSLRNKYVKYLFTINLVGHTEYGYFYVDNNLQIIDFDPDIGI